jgi:hypothetical protein
VRNESSVVCLFFRFFVESSLSLPSFISLFSNFFLVLVLYPSLPSSILVNAGCTTQRMTVHSTDVQVRTGKRGLERFGSLCYALYVC